MASNYYEISSSSNSVKLCATSSCQTYVTITNGSSFAPKVYELKTNGVEHYDSSTLFERFDQNINDFPASSASGYSNIYYVFISVDISTSTSKSPQLTYYSYLSKTGSTDLRYAANIYSSLLLLRESDTHSYLSEVITLNTTTSFPGLFQYTHAIFFNGSSSSQPLSDALYFVFSGANLGVNNSGGVITTDYEDMCIGINGLPEECKPQPSSGYTHEPSRIFTIDYKFETAAPLAEVHIIAKNSSGSEVILGVDKFDLLEGEFVSPSDASTQYMAFRRIYEGQISRQDNTLRNGTWTLLVRAYAFSDTYDPTLSNPKNLIKRQYEEVVYQDIIIWNSITIFDFRLYNLDETKDGYIGLTTTGSLERAYVDSDVDCSGCTYEITANSEIQLIFSHNWNNTSVPYYFDVAGYDTTQTTEHIITLTAKKGTKTKTMTHKLIIDPIRPKVVVEVDGNEYKIGETIGISEGSEVNIIYSDNLELLETPNFWKNDYVYVLKDSASNTTIDSLIWKDYTWTDNHKEVKISFKVPKKEDLNSNILNLEVYTYIMDIGSGNAFFDGQSKYISWNVLFRIYL